LLLALTGAAGEYRHRTAAPAALVGRDRGNVLLARATAYSIAGVAIAAGMAVAAIGVGLPLLGAEPGPDLTGGDIAIVVGGSLLAAVLSAMMGVGAGALARNQVATVTGVLALAFIVQPLIAQVDATVAGYTPFGAMFTLAGAADETSLAPGYAGLVLAAWAIPTLIAAVIAERRRDLA
jgi:hypothetical protein